MKKIISCIEFIVFLDLSRLINSIKWSGLWPYGAFNLFNLSNLARKAK